MGFLQAAFINKNTPELRNKLEKIGYKPCHQMTLHPDDNNNLFVDNIFSDIYYSYDEENMTIFKDSINTAIREGRLVECDDNEDLFLAIAALRDDTDKNQYFICIETYTDYFDITHDKGYFAKCLTDNISNQKQWRKATVEELIEHFVYLENFKD